jgi:Iap family predicted aminopeptidase
MRTLLLYSLLLCQWIILPVATAQTNLPSIFPNHEISSELIAVPKKNILRLEQAARLFAQAGADIDQIERLAVSGDSLYNLRVVHPGRTGRVIIVCAHADFKGPGDGIIDNWSGVVAVTNLYQAMLAMQTRNTFHFLVFAGEEDGLVGSRRYTGALSQREVSSIDAVINLECLGVGPTAVWSNNSDATLQQHFWNTVEAIGLPAVDGPVPGVNADSTPFAERGVPVITLHSLSQPEQMQLIHSPGDNADNIRMDNYFDSFHLLRAFLTTLDKRQ